MQGLTYTGGAEASPQSLCCLPPPVKVPFCLKMSEYHAEIAGNQITFLKMHTSPPFHFFICHSDAPFRA